MAKLKLVRPDAEDGRSVDPQEHLSQAAHGLAAVVRREGRAVDEFQRHMEALDASMKRLGKSLDHYQQVLSTIQCDKLLRRSRRMARIMDRYLATLE